MPNLNFWSAFEFTALDGSAMGGGSLDVASIVAGLNQKYENTLYNLAQNSIGTLWDYLHGPGDFSFCMIQSSVGDLVTPVMLEIATDLQGLTGVKYSTVPLLAGVPFVLFGSQSYASDYTSNFAAGTLRKIQQFKVKNLNAAAANVSIWLAL